jgi:hypothetical protein
MNKQCRGRFSEEITVPTLLDQAIIELKALPDDAQAEITHDLIEMIRSERKWDDLFADPRSASLLKELAAEADGDSAAGRDFDFEPATQVGSEAPK